MCVGVGVCVFTAASAKVAFETHSEVILSLSLVALNHMDIHLPCKYLWASGRTELV